MEPNSLPCEYTDCLKTKELKSCIITGRIMGLNVSVHTEASPNPSLSIALKGEASLYL